MTIPRIIHRMWVGPPMPEQLAAYGDTWVDHHPHWEHRFWDETNLPVLRNQALYDAAEAIAPNHVGQLRADIARYELLHTFGGVWVDTDFECRRPLDELLDGVDLFAAWEVPDIWINNAILGATPGHPFLEQLIRGLPLNVQRHRGARPNRLSGPQYLTKVWRRGGHELTVLDKDLFYPYLHFELDRAGGEFPDAYAIHHWANKRRERGRLLPADGVGAS